LQVLSSDLRAELEWLNTTALKYIKNYQIWHHRQTLITLLAAQEPGTLLTSAPLPAGQASKIPEIEGGNPPNFLDAERAFLNAMLDKDAKNYHVWSYRQWLVRKFDLWDSDATSSTLSVSAKTLLSVYTFEHTSSSNPQPSRASSEISDILHYLHTDIRNNSAWNHRFFLIFGRHEMHSSPSTQTISSPTLPQSILSREISFAQDAIRIAPQNESPWNYLRGVLRRFEAPLGVVEGFAREFADVTKEGKGAGVRSSYALDVLAEVYAEDAGKRGMAERALELLETRYDVIRAGYWAYRRRELLGEKEGVKA